MMRAMFLIALVLAAPLVHAQSTIVLDSTRLAADAPCKAGDVVLSPDAAVAAAKRLTAAETKVAVYEKNPPLPWWAGVIIGVVAAGVGVGVTVAVYEGVKKP